jgi:hypothetical protein
MRLSLSFPSGAREVFLPKSLLDMVGEYLPERLCVRVTSKKTVRHE